MNFKLKTFFYVLVTFLCLNVLGVGVSWNPSLSSTNVTGYKIYYGTASRNYNTIIDVGNNTNGIINNSNLSPNKVYYVAVTAYNSTNEADFSDEAIWTNNVSTLNVTFIGVQIDYGLNLTSLTSKQIMVMTVTNQPGYFYNENLIITNNPFIGTKPVDGNNYVYIGTLMSYGASLTNLNSSRFPLITFTNPPAYFYRSSLIITNNPF